MATPLFRSKEQEESWRADHAGQQLGHRKRNLRWPTILGLAVLGLAGVYAIEGKVWEWFWRPKPSTKEIQPAFNTGALQAFVHPAIDVPPTRTVQQTIEIPKPAAPVPPSPKVQIERFHPSFKIAFAPDDKPIESFTVDGRRPVEGWGCAIRPGQNDIKAAMVDEVRWDFGGPIRARVTEDVMSPEALAVGERRKLIPQGAVLVGHANSEALQRGMNLAPGPIWDAANFTDSAGNPQSINLASAQGAGPSGINAIGGKVDQHWDQIIEAAVFFTLLDTLSSVRINVNLGNSSDSSQTVNASGLAVGGSAAARIGEDVIKNMLSWKPVIFTPAGQLITVKPVRPIRVC